MTGALSSLDAPALNGAKLKAKEINDAGGINGKQIELVVYDTKTDPTVIASTASQLVNQDKVPVAIGFTDSELGARAGADLPAGRHPLRHAGRDLAEAARPDRRHHLPRLLRRQRAGGGRRRFRQEEAEGEERLSPARQLGAEYTTLLAQYFDDAFTQDGGRSSRADDYKTGDKPSPRRSPS